MVAIIVITLVCAVISEIATASRQIWSFARDKGLPFSDFLSKVRKLSTVPCPSPPKTISHHINTIVISTLSSGSARLDDTTV